MIPGEPVVLLCCGLILGLFWGVRYVYMGLVAARRNRARLRTARLLLGYLRRSGAGDSPAGRAELRARVLPALREGH